MSTAPSVSGHSTKTTKNCLKTVERQIKKRREPVSYLCDGEKLRERVTGNRIRGDPPTASRNSRIKRLLAGLFPNEHCVCGTRKRPYCVPVSAGWACLSLRDASQVCGARDPFEAEFQAKLTLRFRAFCASNVLRRTRSAEMTMLEYPRRDVSYFPSFAPTFR